VSALLQTVAVRRRALVGAAVGVIMGAGIWPLLPHREASEFAFIVDAETPSVPTGLSGLVGLVGGENASSSPEFYAYLATSQEVLYRVACRVSANPDACDSGQFNRERLAKAVGILQKRVSATATRTTGVVSVRVVAPKDSEAVTVAEALLQTLDRFDRGIRNSRASVELAAAQRLRDSALTSLDETENNVRHFLETNRISQSPRLSVELQRLQRRLDLANQLYLGLARDAQQAELKKSRDTPTITVLQRPRLPAQRLSPPSIAKFLAGTLALGALTGVFLGIARVRRVSAAETAQSPARRGPPAA
jgi:capsule polysaccharide export protein KpsE/RkpR